MHEVVYACTNLVYPCIDLVYPCINLANIFFFGGGGGGGHFQPVGSKVEFYSKPHPRKSFLAPLRRASWPAYSVGAGVGVVT